MQEFSCDVCRVKRTEDEGAGQWYTVGINDYGPFEKRSRKLHIYAWPLGCRSQQDEIVQHACSLTDLVILVTRWATEVLQKRRHAWEHKKAK
jgi:hypothetical protein